MDWLCLKPPESITKIGGDVAGLAVISRTINRPDGQKWATVLLVIAGDPPSYNNSTLKFKDVLAYLAKVRLLKSSR